MIGLQAISANNGWSMAFVGALIVMCGLASLSFIISQLHKIIGLFEKIARIQGDPQPRGVHRFDDA
ncbi:MAG: hypothetical protein P8Y04_10475, partial [Desulfobulbaceae bacterium]